MMMQNRSLVLNLLEKIFSLLGSIIYRIIVCLFIPALVCVGICNATLTYEIASFRDSLAVTRQRRRQLLGELLPPPPNFDGK